MSYRDTTEPREASARQYPRMVRPQERGPDRPRVAYDLWAALIALAAAWAALIYVAGQRMGWWS